MSSVLTNVFSSEKWGGKIFVGFTHFVGDDIIGSKDVRLSIEEARQLIDELAGAVNIIESREGK